MAQAGRIPTAIPDLAELHRYQSSPEGMIAAHVVDLVATVAELEKLAGKSGSLLPDRRRAGRSSSRPHSPQPPRVRHLPDRRGSGMNAFERHGIDHQPHP
jgi:hypothetical protein